MRENCTPGSVRGASGNWRPYRDVRQAKLGAFGGVRVPAREGLTTHLYRVLQWWRRFNELNETLKRTQGIT